MTRIKEVFSSTFNEHENGSPDRKVFVICVVTALCLTMNEYLPALISIIHFSENEQLSELANWVFVLCTFYFIIPVLVIKLLFKENLSDYGLKWKGAFKDYWIYIVMLAVMIPLVAFFSTTKSFQAKYPFYDLSAGETLYPNVPQLCVRAGGRDEVLSPDTNAKAKIQTVRTTENPPETQR